MPSQFTSPPQHPATSKSYLILKYSHDTANSLLAAFDKVRLSRNAGAGRPTDEEQDLLRAMVVFAGAGIDSMTKQLIRDALPVLVSTSYEARAHIEGLTARHLRRGAADVSDEGGDLAQVNPSRLARVLLADNPRDGLVELLVQDLTAGSLQSVEELYRVLAYLRLKPANVGVDERDLREVFHCRNRLIHEMDIDFNRPAGNRSSRAKTSMVKYAGWLLTAAGNILKGVDDQLPPPPAPRRGRPPRAR